MDVPGLGLLILVLSSNPTTLVGSGRAYHAGLVGLVRLFAGQGPRSAVAGSAGTVATQPKKTTTEE